MVEVPIEEIANNSYSLNYAEYIKDETEEQYEEGVVVKTLGEVCKFLPKSKEMHLMVKNMEHIHFIHRLKLVVNIVNMIMKMNV